MSARRFTDPLRAMLDQIDQGLGEITTAKLRVMLSAANELAALFAQAHPGVELARLPVSELLLWAKREIEKR